jgi:hypothetical protein
MTVKELIEALSKMAPDKEVCVLRGDAWHACHDPVASIREDADTVTLL